MPKSKQDKSEESHVLYRKYRPEAFSDVLGQDHIVSVLEKSITSGKIAHAYLFCGSRGTGKTSIARIFAKQLGTSVNDLYEIDAASNNKVEDVHLLREGVRTLPFDSKYKIYILDEVHMMSKGAFNALLKTLEEPPAHVIFILATTELEKVPDTIVSRCQIFTFKKPTDAILRDVVISISKKEGFTIDEAGAELIAMLGDGSFRDTEGVLEKVLTFAPNKKIKIEDIESITGAPARALVYNVLFAIGERDLPKALEAIRNVEKQNTDMGLFVKLLIHLFRGALVLRVAPNHKELTAEMNDTDKKQLSDLISKHAVMINSLNFSNILDAYQKMRYSFIASLPLELALIEMLGEKE